MYIHTKRIPFLQFWYGTLKNTNTYDHRSETNVQGEGHDDAISRIVSEIN